MKAKIFVAILIITLAIAASGCSGQGASPFGQEYSAHTYFQETIERLGGAQFVGPALSSTQPTQYGFRQYFNSVVLEYLEATQSVLIVPIGSSLVTPEDPAQNPISSDTYLVNGYMIPANFYTYYMLLGEENTGKPITNYRFNAALGRYEMYFEKIGLFQWVDDPNQYVRPIPYGQYAWAEIGTETGILEEFGPVSTPGPNTGFDQIGARLGPDFTGEQLIAMYTETDGRLVRIYANLVLDSDPQDGYHVRFRQVPLEIGIQRSPLKEKLNSEQYYFLPIDGTFGYNIPLQFWNYIVSHGGLETSGYPITGLFESSEQPGVYKQCFENLCLQYDANQQQISVDDLGRLYYERFYRPEENLATPEPLYLSMMVWEESPTISPLTEQVVFVKVLHNDAPVPGAYPVIEITLPAGNVVSYNLPATGADGQSSVVVPPILAENATVIPYQVCVASQPGTSFCIQDSYLIWQEP